MKVMLRLEIQSDEYYRVDGFGIAAARVKGSGSDAALTFTAVVAVLDIVELTAEYSCPTDNSNTLKRNRYQCGTAGTMFRGLLRCWPTHTAPAPNRHILRERPRTRQAADFHRCGYCVPTCSYSCRCRVTDLRT